MENRLVNIYVIQELNSDDEVRLSITLKEKEIES